VAHARFAVMSGDAAASTLVEIKLKQLERDGRKVDEKQKKDLYDSVRATTNTKPTRATPPPISGLMPSSIPPHRDALIWALEAAALNPDIRELKQAFYNMISRRSKRLLSVPHCASRLGFAVLADWLPERSLRAAFQAGLSTKRHRGTFRRLLWSPTSDCSSQSAPLSQFYWIIDAQGNGCPT